MKHKRTPLVIISTLTLLFLVAGCKQDMSDQFGTALQMVLEDTLLQHNGPGAFLAVRFDDGSTWTGATGLAQIGTEAPSPLTSEHYFRIGSVTKTFTGTAALLLAQNGKLRIEDTLNDWLPGKVPDGDSITIRMLLNHSSGLFDYTWDETFLDLYTDNLTRVWNTDELLTIAISYEPVAEPGGDGIYSNTNYILLGMIIEAASDMPIEQYITDTILTPLGLCNTSFPVTAEIPEKYSHGYLDLNGDDLFSTDEDVTAQHPSAIWSAGAMISKPADLLCWLDELTDSTLLSNELQAERLAFDVPIDGAPEDFFGLGIAKLGDAVGHTGALPGYQTMLFRYRNTDFVVYCNGYLTTDNSANIAFEIYEAARQILFPDILSSN